MLRQGRDKAVEVVRADEQLSKQIEEATRAALSASPEILLGDEEEGGEDIDPLADETEPDAAQ